jgi:hypothetical protein
MSLLIAEQKYLKESSLLSFKETQSSNAANRTLNSSSCLKKIPKKRVDLMVEQVK